MSDTEVSAQQTTTSGEEVVATNGAKRGRGRPKKAVASATSKKTVTNNGVSETNGTNGSESEATLPKKRGRKPKADEPNKELKAVSSGNAGNGAKRGRGRPKKSQTKANQPKKGRPKKSARRQSVEDEDNTGDEEDRPEDEEDAEEDEDED